MRPELRSLVLVRENRAYCSTVHGEYQPLVDPGSFFNQRLRLEPGNDVTPDSAILYYRLQEYPLGVLALVDAKTLQATMQRVKASANLVLQFGDDYLWSEGSTFDDVLPDHPNSMSACCPPVTGTPSMAATRTAISGRRCCPTPRPSSRRCCWWVS